MDGGGGGFSHSNRKATRVSSRARPFREAGQGHVGGGPCINRVTGRESGLEWVQGWRSRKRRLHTGLWSQALPGDTGKVGQFQGWGGGERSARNKWWEVRLLRRLNRAQDLETGASLAQQEEWKPILDTLSDGPFPKHGNVIICDVHYGGHVSP